MKGLFNYFYFQIMDILTYTMAGTAKNETKSRWWDLK